MKADDRRRLEGVERSLARSSLYVPEPFTDAQLIDAMEDGTATPAHMKQVYDICSPDLEIRLFQEGKRQRGFPDYRDFTPSRSDTLRVGAAALLLGYRADEEPGFELDWLPIESHPWAETNDGQHLIFSDSHDPFHFPIWARGVLLAWLLDHDPSALAFRRRLDEWCDGGDPPVDLLRYPEPRVYRLLNPIGQSIHTRVDIEMLRFPHKDLYLRLGFYPYDDPPDEGLLWTEVDSLGRRVIPSMYD